MQFSTSISLEQAPAIAQELQKRMDALEIDKANLAYQAEISCTTLEKILAGDQNYSRRILLRVTRALDYMEYREEKGLYPLYETSPLLAIGEKVRKIREDSGYSYAAMTRMARVSEATVRKIENGEYHAEVETFKRILTDLSCPSNEIEILIGNILPTQESGLEWWRMLNHELPKRAWKGYIPNKYRKNETGEQPCR